MVNTNDFRRALIFVLKWEGGYVCNPNDPGGETKWGISKRAYPNLDIRNLSEEDAAKIYARDYWDACGCDSIVFPDCVAVFDTAVNCGVGRARGWLKGSKDIKEFIQKRVDHYTLLARNDPKLKPFLNGWLNRVNDLKKYIDIQSSSV